jgi:hypothetical protein
MSAHRPAGPHKRWPATEEFNRMDLNDQSSSPDQEEWKPTSALYLALTALGLGWAVQFLFYGRPIGISFPIWVALALACLYLWSRREGRTPAKEMALVFVLIVALAALVPLRVEPLTTFSATALTFVLLAILVRGYRPGRLLEWGWFDILVAVVWVPLEAWIRPWGTLTTAQSRLTGGEQSKSTALAIVRGALLALPILIVFGALLSAADLVFGDWVQQALSWLDLEWFFNLVGRTIVMLVAGLFLLGAVVAALRRGREEPRLNDGEPLLKPFLGMVEALIVLGSVDLLFALFVLVQARYFFGGEVNISQAGYTYAEYARRGFGELVFASVLALGMILALASWVRRQDSRAGGWFNGLSGGLVLMTGVMLLSAYQRLTLYEEAYGFTRLRSYTHIAIGWLAVLFIVFLILLFTHHLRRFAPISLLAAVGFAMTLGAVNVDARIVKHNFEYIDSIGELDAYYLTTLSDDAVPAIVARLDQVPDDKLPRVLAGLSCRRYLLDQAAERTDWRSYRWPSARARTALATVSDQLDAYSVEETDYGYGQISFGQDGIQTCYPYPF